MCVISACALVNYHTITHLFLFLFVCHINNRKSLVEPQLSVIMSSFTCPVFRKVDVVSACGFRMSKEMVELNFQQQ